MDYWKYAVRRRKSSDGIEEAEGEVKVLSWNVNGLSRAKMESEDFVNNIAVNDIVFLYESWTFWICVPQHL